MTNPSITLNDLDDLIYTILSLEIYRSPVAPVHQVGSHQPETGPDFSLTDKQLVYHCFFLPSFPKSSSSDRLYFSVYSRPPYIASVRLHSLASSPAACPCCTFATINTHLHPGGDRGVGAVRGTTCFPNGRRDLDSLGDQIIFIST